MFGQKILTKGEMRRISGTIAEIEKTTAGEIRVSIHRRRRWRERKLSLFDIAVREFHRLGMSRTKDHIGVLLFICIKDRAFQIIADEGIHKRVDQQYWNQLATNLSEHFRGDKFCDGICEIVRELQKTLTKEFPIKRGDKNELSNDVISE